MTVHHARVVALAAVLVGISALSGDQPHHWSWSRSSLLGHPRKPRYGRLQLTEPSCAPRADPVAPASSQAAARVPLPSWLRL